MEKTEMLLKLTDEMYKFYESDPNHIQHFIKVHSFARQIGLSEKLDERTQFILEAATIVHDIGIKPALIKFGSDAGPYQEELGMPEAEKMLAKLGFDDELIKRVVYLVGHHHTYSNIDGIDYRILVEADFLVNMYESGMKAEAIKTAYEKYFVTETGKHIAKVMFGIE